MITEHVLFFYMLGVGLLAFIFHEIDDRSKDVLPTEYSKLASPIERRLYNALVLNGYCVQAQVKCGPYRIDLVIGKLAIECDGKSLILFHRKRLMTERKMLI
ncbi:hypothetical protein [Priestia aryabhattai]|uniref:hypothetical protein n=1 Tax=Priestia aryabhattai TaxID=412384 RepID=UPI001FD7DE23|nr:hypothetical protein [Priestia aryabhattai]